MSKFEIRIEELNPMWGVLISSSIYVVPIQPEKELK